MFLGKSNELKTYENLLILEMRRQAKLQNITEPYKGPVWVMMLFFFKNFYTKKGEMNLKLGDLSNLYQLPEDCLQESGIIANDSLIMAHDLSRKLHGPETLLEIFVFKHEQLNARPS
jgi:Holliday junction resolvase RusA-like endonuclease